MTLGPDEKDFIAEVIAEDNEARKVRTIGEQVKRVPRLSDDPAVRLAECRGEAVAFYEEAERALFEAFYSERAKTLPLPLGDNPVRYAGGQYVNDFALFGWITWLACAKSRAGVV